MKRLLIIILTITLLPTMLLTPILADVDVNGSAIGGNMGSAVDGNNVWYGDEFARVTAYDSLGNPIGSVDYSNSNPNNIDYYGSADKAIIEMVAI